MQEIILLLKMLQMLKDSKIILRSFDENNQLLGQSIAPFQYGQQALSMLRSLLTPQQFNEAYLQITEYIHQFQLDSLTLDLTVGGGSIEATPIIQLPETLTAVPHLQLTTHIDNSNEQIVTVTFVNADTLINMGGSLELSAYYSDEYGSTEPQIVASLQIQSNWDGTKELVVQKNRKFYVQQRHHRNGNYSQWSAYQSIKTQRTQTMPPMLRLYDESHPFTKIYQGQIISLKNPYLYGLPQGEFKKIEVSYELDGKILKKEIDTLMYTTDEQQPQQKVDVLVELRPNQSDITVYLTLTDTSDNTSTQLIVQNVQALPFSEQEKDIHDVIVDNRHRLNVMNQLDEWAGVIKNITPVDTDTYILRIENIAGTQDNGLIDNEGQIVVYHQLDNGQTYTSPYYIKSIELDSDNTKGTFTISQTGQFVQQVGDQVRITGSVNALHHSERYTVDGLVKSMQKHESHEIVLTLTNGTFELGSGNVLKIKGDNLNYQFDDYKNKPAQFVDLGYSQEIQTVGGRKFNSRVIEKQNNILSVPLEDYKGESIVGSTVIIRSVDQFTQKQLIDEYNKLSSVIASNYFTEIYTGTVAAHQNIDGKQKFTLTLDQPYTGSLLTNLNLPTGLVLETTVYQDINPLLTKYFNITKVEPTYVVCDRPIEYNEIFTTSCQPKFRILKPTDQLQSAITQTKDEISLAVKQIGGWQDQSPTTLGSQLSITANQIDMTVQYQTVENGQTVTKHVGLVLSNDGSIKMVGKHVDFQSDVSINGNLLVTGTVDANKIVANSITAQQIQTSNFFTTNFKLQNNGSISTAIGESSKTFQDGQAGVYLSKDQFEIYQQNNQYFRFNQQPGVNTIELMQKNFSIGADGSGSMQNGLITWTPSGQINVSAVVSDKILQNNQTITNRLTIGTNGAIQSEGKDWSSNFGQHNGFYIDKNKFEISQAASGNPAQYIRVDFSNLSDPVFAIQTKNAQFNPDGSGSIQAGAISWTNTGVISQNAMVTNQILQNNQTITQMLELGQNGIIRTAGKHFGVLNNTVADGLYISSNLFELYKNNSGPDQQYIRFNQSNSDVNGVPAGSLSIKTKNLQFNQDGSGFLQGGKLAWDQNGQITANAIFQAEQDISQRLNLGDNAVIATKTKTQYGNGQQGLLLSKDKFELYKNNNAYIRTNLDAGTEYIEIKTPTFQLDPDGAGRLQNGQLSWDATGKITANSILQVDQEITQKLTLGTNAAIVSKTKTGFGDSHQGVFIDKDKFEIYKNSNSYLRTDLSAGTGYIEIKTPTFQLDSDGAGRLQGGQLQWDQNGTITQNSLIANSVFQQNQTISQILTLGTDAVIVSEGTTYSVDTLPNGNARRINADSSGVLIDKTTLHLRNTSDQFANSEILFDTNDGTLNINMLKGSQTLNNTKLVKTGTYNGHQYEIQSFSITGDAVNITRTFNSNSTSDTLGIGELPDWYNPDAGSGTLQGLDPITQQSNKNHKLMLLLYEGKVQTDSNGNAEFDLPYHKFTVPELNNNRVSVDVNPTILNITPVNVNGDYIMAVPTIEQTITQSQSQPNGILNRIKVTSQQKKINTMQLNTQYVYPGLSVFQNHSNDTSTQDNHKRIGTNLYGYNYKTAFHGTLFYDSARGNYQFNMNTSFQPSNSYSIATQQITNDRQIKQITLNFPGIGVDKVIELPNVVNTNSIIKVNVRYTVQEIGCYVESRNYLHIWWEGIIPYRITGQVVQPYIVVSVKVDSIQVNGSTVVSNIPIGSYKVNSTDPNFYNFAGARLVYQLNNYYNVPQISDYWILGKIITPSNVENAGKFRISQAMGVYSTPAPNCEAYVKVYYQL